MLHVIFSPSGAGTLRQALRAQGLTHALAGLHESLDWGPITSNSFDDREAWLKNNIPFGEMGSPLEDASCDWIASGVREFEAKVESDPDRLIWIASQSARELCALHWYLDRFGAEGARMIVANYPLDDTWENPPRGLGEPNSDQFSALFDHAERQPWDPARFPADRWKEFRTEASLLRIVQGGRITSVSEDYFDARLLARCSDKWQKWHRIVGGTMGQLWDENHDVDDRFLSWRLRVLAEQGRIESNREIKACPEANRDPLLIRLS